MNQVSSASNQNLIESILIVDDQLTNLRVLSQILQGKNYKVKQASEYLCRNWVD